MPPRSRFSGLLALGFTASLAALSSTSQLPPRDTLATVSSGDAVVAGSVLTGDEQPAPIRRVLLTLKGAGLFPDRLTTTDDHGQFEFADLPPGRYTLSASKNGFVDDRYGSRHPGGPGSPIAVTAGQRASVSMKLTRAAVISGALRLPPGMAPDSMVVNVMRVDTVNGVRRLVATNAGALTDDLGAYRVYGLAPGAYAVYYVTTRASVEMRMTTIADLQWAARQFGPRAPTSVSSAPQAPDDARPVTFAPTYYPGTLNEADAATITLGPGEERSGVDIPVQFEPTARLDGIVLDPQDQPATSFNIQVIDPASQVPRLSLAPRRGPNGTFSSAGLTPGRYLLVARGASGPVAPGATPAGPLGPPPLPLWAMETIDVNGRDIPNMALHLQPGMTVAGKIALDDTLPPAADLTRVRVTLTAVETPTSTFFAVPSVQASADGSFIVPSVAPGKYQLTASAAGPVARWTLKSTSVGGRDVSDEPFEVRANQNVSDAVIALTDRPTVLSGTLTDAAGRPAPEFFVAAFSTDPRFWTARSRRTMRTRPATTGAFTITGLPAGDYYLAALTDFQPGQLNDPTFLQDLVAVSIRVTLNDAETKNQNLRLAGVDEGQGAARK